MSPALRLSNEEFKLFQEFISKQCGLSFNESTRESLRVSLLARIRNKGFEDYREYYRYITVHPNGPKEFKELITLLTINETSFFRNPEQFKVFKNFVIPELIEKKTDKSIKIWSAGCSTGEEPYSIAMSVLETLDDLNLWNIEILGTDIDKKALERTEKGLYRKMSLRLTSRNYIDKYFKEADGKFKISDKVKSMVNFDYFNLAEKFFPVPVKGEWDVIFCRNVLIYFEQHKVPEVINRFYRSITEGGYYFVGYSEILSKYNNDFETVKFNDIFIYKKLLGVKT